VVNVHVGGDSVRPAGVGAGPGAASGIAVGANSHAGAVTAEDVLAVFRVSTYESNLERERGDVPSIAGALNGVPVGEQAAVIGAVVNDAADGQAVKLGPGGRRGGNARLGEYCQQGPDGAK
jgi:hypothetical protein